MRELTLAPGQEPDIRADELVFCDIELSGFRCIALVNDEDFVQDKLRVRRENRRRKYATQQL